MGHEACGMSAMPRARYSCLITHASCPVLSGFLLGCAERLLEGGDEFGQGLLRHDVGWQQADDVLSCAADDEAFGEQLGEDGLGGTIELDAPHHAHAADVDDGW